MDVTKEVLDLFWDRVDGEVVIWIRDRYNSDSDFKKIIDAPGCGGRVRRVFYKLSYKG